MKDTAKRAYHHGDLRRALVETALEMLDEDDGWQFTLREVARRSGVSHAAPYKHFADKGSLLAELALQGFDRLRAAVTAARLPSSADARAEFFAMTRAYVHFGQSNVNLYRLMFSADAHATGIHSNDRAVAALNVLVEWLERGQRDGRLRVRDVRAQAAACWAQLHGLTLLSVDGLLMPEKVGPNALDGSLAVLLEGLERPDGAEK